MRPPWLSSPPPLQSSRKPSIRCELISRRRSRKCSRNQKLGTSKRDRTSIRSQSRNVTSGETVDVKTDAAGKVLAADRGRAVAALTMRMIRGLSAAVAMRMDFDLSDIKSHDKRRFEQEATEITEEMAFIVSLRFLR